MTKTIFMLLMISVFLTATITINAADAKSAVESSDTRNLFRLTVTDLKSGQYQLDDWADKVIILNFWATWCGPCQIEIPHLIKYQSAYSDAGLQVIGVGLDEQRKLDNYARTVGINYPVLRADPQQHRHLLQDWGNPANVLPYTVVINKQGQKVYSKVGIFNDDAFNTYVKPLLVNDSELTTPAQSSP